MFFIHPTVLSWCTGSQGNNHCYESLFRSHWLAVMYCLVLCIGFFELVHEDKTRLGTSKKSLIQNEENSEYVYNVQSEKTITKIK